MKTYSAEQLNNIAFALGGMGAGTICFTGWGSLDSMAIRHRPEKFFTPTAFSAITVLNEKNETRLLEAPVPKVHYFTNVPEAGRGFFVTPKGKTYGLPRFTEGEFSAAFPFATLGLNDSAFPIRAEVKAWSPFVPSDEDASSLPFAGLEYILLNKSEEALDDLFYPQ